MGPARVAPPRGGADAVPNQGPDHLLWAISDDIVDGYFPFADGSATRSTPSRTRSSREPDPRRWSGFRAEARADRGPPRVGPAREVFNQLTNRDVDPISPRSLVYFRDVYDHVIRLTDEMDNYRELVAATARRLPLEVNNNLSAIMKRLTGVTVVLAGIGAVAGIFGMSEARARSTAARPLASGS